jgi:MerR family copper efflux transcriptional regulator
VFEARPATTNQKNMKTVTNVNTFKSLQTTSALCKAANVTRGQLRLYEAEGLIAPQRRTEAGYRQYGSDTQDQLKAIMHLKELGFTLAEIALLLSDRDFGEIDVPAIQRLAGEVLSKIDERIAGLQVIRGYVAPVAAGDMGVLEDDDCNFVIEFMTALSADKSKRRA